MPRQNRVDPFGRIVAHAARGMLMGNRGCLHDEAGQIVRESSRDAWISCMPTWPNTRRELMRPGHYTELFFLDEVTAMAAGHRPCGSCRPEALAAFKAAWRRHTKLNHSPQVSEIDRSLRSAEPWHGKNDAMPDGTMVKVDGAIMLVWQGRWLPWRFAGYEKAVTPFGPSVVITPPPMVQVLAAGYCPSIHPTAR